MAAHFDLNIILVGIDKFPAPKLQQVTDSITVMTLIYANLGPIVGTVKRFHINSADTGGLHILKDDADAETLAEQWLVKNDGIDLFVVTDWIVHDGLSPRPGKCPKERRKNLRSPIVSLNGLAPNSGNTFAHEIGHYLGLPHAEVDQTLVGSAFVAANFMKANSKANIEMTVAQSEKMRSHCSIKF